MVLSGKRGESVTDTEGRLIIEEEEKLHAV